MESIIIHPKDKMEFELLKQILTKMNISCNVISKENQEDLGLSILMKEADCTQKFSKETIMKRL